MKVPSRRQEVPAAFDIAITSPHRADLVVSASLKPGAAAEAYQAASNEEGDEAQAEAAPEGNSGAEDKQEDGPVVDAEVVDEDKK